VGQPGEILVANVNMPGIVGASGHSAKRKRVLSEKRPSKRAKSESSDEEDDTQSQLLLLETEIVESKNYEKIATLINILRTDGEPSDNSIIAAISLYRVFAKLIASGDLSNKPGDTEEKLMKRYSNYKSALVILLGEQETSSTAFTLCMRLLKIEGENLRQGQDHSFPADFLTEIVRVLLNSEDAAARKEFSETYVEEYDDIRFYTLKAIE
jgi:U3 small nucleolar RNA-associated protein 19